MNDFERVAAMIRFLEENQRQQPDLEQLAAACGLSRSHFHRLFRRWAGVTPKDFLQCLTLEHAKQRLRESASVLDAALDSGLSGPGRLHDLFVTLDAVSPGQFKSGGEHAKISWGAAETPFGGCCIGWNTRGICHLAFLDSEKISGEQADLLNAWPNAQFSRNDRGAKRWAKSIFHDSHQRAAPLRAWVRATPFQLKVWRALLRIPEGCVTSYRAIADAIGEPNAARAVGAACGANPIGYLIPCHRVIRETGVVQGYRWGETRKRALLAWESTHSTTLKV